MSRGWKYWKYLICRGWAYSRRDNSWLDKTRIAVLIWLVRTVPRFRGWHITRQFEIANLNYRRRYVAAECKHDVYEGRNYSSCEENIILAFIEKDYRYEWLELALERNHICCRIIYMPRNIFEQPVLFFLKDFLTEGALDHDKVATYRNQFQIKTQELRNYLERILRTIIDEYQPSAFMSASIGDLRLREVIKVARQLGLPWIVTEREGVIAPIVSQKIVPFAQKYFDTAVDLMCTSNQIHRDYWEKIGVHGGKIAITGDLKSDIWKNEKCWPTRGNIHPNLSETKILILYFACGAKNYISDKTYPNEKRDWTELLMEHHEVLREIALRYRDRVQIVLKSGHPGDLAVSFYGGFIEETLGNVLVLTHTYKALDLIINADVIIGFQTTAMIESMFTDKPILYPAWGELYSEIADDLIPLHRSGVVEWVHSKEELHDKLVSFVNNRESLVVNSEMLLNRKEFRERYYYQPDGNVGLRTYQAIQGLLMARKKRTVSSAG